MRSCHGGCVAHIYLVWCKACNNHICNWDGDTWEKPWVVSLILLLQLIFILMLRKIRQYWRNSNIVISYNTMMFYKYRFRHNISLIWNLGCGDKGNPMQDTHFLFCSLTAQSCMFRQLKKYNYFFVGKKRRKEKFFEKFDGKII